MSTNANGFIEMFNAEKKSHATTSEILAMENAFLAHDWTEFDAKFLSVLQNCTKKKTARTALEIYLREQNTI